MMLGFIYLARNEKDSIVHIFKDVHQSNLDDIEEQEKEEAKLNAINNLPLIWAFTLFYGHQPH